MKIVLGVLGVIWGLGIIGLGDYIGSLIGGDGWIVSIIVSMVIAIISVMIIYTVIDEKILSNASKSHKMDYKTGTLHVKEKNFRFSYLIELKKHDIVSQHYVPESYIYTGMTVGGVSVGEINKTGDYYEAHLRKSDKGELHYDSTMIRTIVFDGDILSVAKNSSIGKYIEGDSIVLVKSVKPSAGTATLINAGKSVDAINNFAHDIAEAYRTYKECKEIFDWICS